jgi:UDPglucose 6-dehydrogenase
MKEFEENQLSHGRWNFEKDIYKSAKNADAIIIITEWQEYRELNWQKLSSLMRKPAWIFDTRKIVPKDNMIKLGINFWQVGSPNIKI